MNKVTRKKLWKGFILFTLLANIVGVGLNMFTETYWGALGHASCALFTVFMFLDTLEQGEEADDDEQ
jgi:hypothetical protein